ncbi:serine/threonine-protein kinase pakD-like isoform X2 [Aphidius gifuensis]|uniref:serine/threonine-protein kinase pakD-like isoform X2 n=1 Tax=Aphidius gifuensis TaxID=684658 RepID=UPI001CDC4B36|nr:serine/threonine-protein kinase pakD-like isoform X2 [Aphidius gifuensis]
MYNRKSKITDSSGKKLSVDEKIKNMTVQNRNDVRKKKKFPEQSPVKKKTLQNCIENEISSCNGDGRATSSSSSSSSWPEDIEEAATRKVFDLWYIVERTLYNEDDQVPLGNIMDECIQWRTQIPHLRLVGKSMKLEIADEDSDYKTSGEIKNSTEKFKTVKNQENELKQDKKKPITLSPYQLKVRDEVIDLIVDYISDELKKQSDNNSSVENLDKVLRITPAPTCAKNNNSNNKNKNKLNNNNTSSRMSSANRIKTFELTERSALNKLSKNAKNAINNYDDNADDDDESDSVEIQIGRNKLGTVFNKKTVVSPVPFAVTTRESFCTLKTTPIKYAGHLLELSTPHGTNRHVNSMSKLNSGSRVSLLRNTDKYYSWQTPVRSAVYPKNIRLAPIDPARLSSNKNREIH